MHSRLSSESVELQRYIEISQRSLQELVQSQREALLGEKMRRANRSQKFPIVITYTSETQHEMLLLCCYLREILGAEAYVHGLMCEEGRYWETSYFEWMEHASVILVLFSPQYFTREACRKEFLKACSLIDRDDPERILIPVVLTPRGSEHKFPAADPYLQKCDHEFREIALRELSRNCFPRPDDRPLIDAFAESATMLCEIIRKYVEDYPMFLKRLLAKRRIAAEQHAAAEAARVAAEAAEAEAAPATEANAKAARVAAHTAARVAFRMAAEVEADDVVAREIAVKATHAACRNPMIAETEAASDQLSSNKEQCNVCSVM
jgi:hypothetical protein